MRLSAFNPGKLRNIVYVLTDDPVRIKQIPRRYVVRQVTGKELYRNITSPLPLRVVGGEYKHLAAWQKQQLVTQRDPRPFNGIARDLFASDLLAVTRSRLANPSEEKEKALLSIGEALGLRGAQIDALNGTALKKGKSRAADRALKQLKRMTMTVVDGNFSRESIAKENLTFAKHTMPQRRNTKGSYDARRQGPGVQNNQGKLYHGSLIPTSGETVAAREPAGLSVPGLARGFGLGAFVFALGLFAVGRRRGARLNSGSFLWLVAIALGASMAFVSVANAQRGQTLASMIEEFKDPGRAEQASTRIASAGPAAVDALLDEVVDSEDLRIRGWAIVTLAQIGGQAADKGLAAIHGSSTENNLVRTWAAAARVSMAADVEALLALQSLPQTFPAVARPFGTRAAAFVRGARTTEDVERALLISNRIPQARQHVQPALMTMSTRRLVRAMMRSKNVQARRLAASYLGGKAASKDSDVAQRTLAALAFDPDDSTVPWQGGALFLPAITWSKEDGTRLADQLMRWFVWADAAGNAGLQQQIHNNLRTGPLAKVAGYVSPSWNATTVEEWLVAWGRVVGKAHIKRILREQGLETTGRYRRLLTRL